MVEGLLRLQAFFLVSDPYASSFHKQYANAPSKMDQHLGRKGFV